MLPSPVQGPLILRIQQFKELNPGLSDVHDSLKIVCADIVEYVDNKFENKDLFHELEEDGCHHLNARRCVAVWLSTFLHVDSGSINVSA